MSGTIERPAEGGGTSTFTFEGNYADNHVTATYRSTDRRNPERGSFCLKVSNKGTILRGAYLWYNTAEGRESVDHGTYEWTQVRE